MRNFSPGMVEKKERNNYPDAIKEYEVAPQIEGIGSVEIGTTSEPLWTERHPTCSR